MRLIPSLLALFVLSSAARAAQIIVKLPDAVTATSARALAPSSKPGEDGPATDGAVKNDQTVTFDHLDANTPYDLEISLKDGHVLRGVNLSWYDEEPPKPNAGDLTDDDREQMWQLVSDIQSFYNISRIITLSGDHNRATVLVERTRSTDFHSDKGGEIIYRMEIWYFKNEFGGWQELTQENKVLIRRRFSSDAQYKAAADPVRWIGALGGVTLTGKPQPLTITLPPDALQPQPPATAPTDSGGANQ